ncbi:MAG: hypothetical protein AVDCRST_MAG70-1753 [uncultured Thermomicrobiales bacterium]|uniref:Amino acid transporter transmembrane domain-containing protein n=1 Tax=uncultured Thermomicrobiales bacterium TaxID=1645740 RepID=A0A6J4V0X2_9BACT|nr:MAG: hypothetical protein AVDCRST_MAG70-1753 [uncultured Thermomicrobiales bacterium]
MGTDWSSFLSRDELLAGLPARRASTLLFAIESRTAHLVQRSRRSLATYLTERSGEAQERDFMDALTQGRDMVAKPSVQDLERYASRWAPLVPPDPGVRATLAHLLGERYHLLDTRTPGITSAIGLTDPTVGERFRALYDAPISSILAQSAPTRERWRWLRAGVSDRLENLPPFWTAFALTLTETVGAGILALPIAFANVGPLAGIIALVVLGLVNIGTIAAMAEAVARNGEIRYGRSYFGRMVREYLGPAGSAIMTPVLFVLVTIILLSYFIGFSSTLADATGLRAEWWAAGLLLVLVYFVRRRNLGATVASALLVGATTISLIVIIALLALPHVKADNLRHAEVPFRDGRPFDASILELVFGVVLFAYFGHTSTAVCAPVVL